MTATTTMDRLIAAIRRGKIRTGADAAAALDVGEAYVWKLLRQARADGYVIEYDPRRHVQPRRPWRITKKGNWK